MPGDLLAADERVLRHLDEHSPEYVPLVANRLGLPLGFAEDRFAVLAEQELVRSAGRESVYELTERGEQYLTAEREIDEPIEGDS